MPEYPIFYSPLIHPDHPFLSEEESVHALKVLRLRPGDPLRIHDGAGKAYLAEIAGSNHRQCSLNLLHILEDSPFTPHSLHIAIAPTKNADRLEWFIEKATEIGIGRITPLLCERSERKRIASDRLLRVIISAMKQSGKLWLPVLDPLTPFRDFIGETRHAKKGIAHCLEGERTPLSRWYEPGTSPILMIGPEGDFSPVEIQEALAQGYQSISLGNSRLRTETAGLVVCQSIALLEEWHGQTIGS